MHFTFAKNRCSILINKEFMPRTAATPVAETVDAARLGTANAAKAMTFGPLRRTLPSDALLNGQREVLIKHGSDIYSLRHTRNGKLILTK